MIQIKSYLSWHSWRQVQSLNLQRWRSSSPSSRKIRLTSTVLIAKRRRLHMLLFGLVRLCAKIAQSIWSSIWLVILSLKYTLKTYSRSIGMIINSGAFSWVGIRRCLIIWRNIIFKIAGKLKDICIRLSTGISKDTEQWWMAALITSKSLSQPEISNKKSIRPKQESEAPSQKLELASSPSAEPPEQKPAI